MTPLDHVYRWTDILAAWQEKYGHQRGTDMAHELERFASCNGELQGFAEIPISETEQYGGPPPEIRVWLEETFPGVETVRIVL